MKWHTLFLLFLPAWKRAWEPGNITAKEAIVGASQIMVPVGVLPPQLHIIECWQDGTSIPTVQEQMRSAAVNHAIAV
ncbi:MAG: hypothetical protein R3B74_14255 [Nitrospirales bacterium]|nr:hypothetical protein [Nitrospirales bacterium]